jgi:hypothetical protein
VTLGEDRLGPAEVDAGRGEIMDALVIASVVRGRAALAWSQVMEAVARSDAPTALVDAVARSKEPAALALVNRQQEVIKALSNGLKAELPVAELQKLNTASLVFSVDIANAALAEMVDLSLQSDDAGIDGVSLF